MSSYMSDADDPSESGSDDNLEHDYETTEDEGQNDSSDNSYSDESDEECGTEMDAPETSISQDRHTINDREVNLDPDDDGSLPDLNDHGFDLSNNNISNATTENENNPGQVINRSVSSSFPTWDGKRLFPPPSSRSSVWQHGGFLKDRTGQLDKKHVVCKHCGKLIKYVGSPSQLSKHLLLVHKMNPNDSESATVDRSLSQSKITDFSGGQASVKKYAKMNPKQVEFNEKIVTWIVKNCRPFEIVNDKALVEAFNIADPKVSIPGPELIKKEVTKLEIKHASQFTEEIKLASWIVTTNDAGSSYGGSGFIDVNAHWINENFELKKKILAVIPVTSGKTAVEYREMVDKVLEQFSIKSKVFMHTTDNEATMSAAFEDSIRNGCLAHLESNACKSAMKKVPVVRKVRAGLRKIAQKFNKSNKFKKAVKRLQKEGNVAVRAIHQEIPTRFTSTFDMFGSILQASKDGDISETIASENISIINKALEQTVNKKEYQKLKINKRAKDVMCELYPILSGLEKGITLMGGEKYATGSSVLPFLFKFNKMLAPDAEDRVYVASVKKEIKKYLAENCSKNLNFEALSCASYLDKRYSTLSFLKPDQIRHVKTKIKEELNILEVSWRASAAPEHPRAKKKRLLSFDIDDDDEMQSDCQAEKEMKSFELEGKLIIDDDPLGWWKGRQSKYPLLSQLAKKYLCIMGTSTSAERVFSAMGRVLTKTRMRMSENMFSSLMFLSDCNLYK